MLEAVDAVCKITGSKKVNISGFCAGGIMTTLMLSYMAAVGDKRVNAAAFGVMLLDFDTEAPIGALHSRKLIGVARKRSQKKGIHPASALAQVFAWMRPNDLVWNYWVNNYLTGQDPPSFDILAWSVDGTNLPGKLHGQFLDIFETNALPKKGSMKILGKPLDLSSIKVQTLVTGGTTDHLTPWKGCYRTTQLLGGPSTFVLSNAGHVASLVNPPGNPKATYWLGPKPGHDAEAWLQQATKHTGPGGKCGSTGRASAAVARSLRRRRSATARTRCSTRRRVRMCWSRRSHGRRGDVSRRSTASWGRSSGVRSGYAWISNGSTNSRIAPATGNGFTSTSSARRVRAHSAAQSRTDT